MNEIFGIPMTGVMITLLIVLTLCLLSVAWVALRRPVVFKMGVRNIPRRRAQSTLIIIGLMLSTMIISAALGTGDTVDYSMKSEVFDTYGQIDEMVVASHDVEADTNVIGGTTIDASALTLVEQAVSGIAGVESVMPILEVNMPALHEAANLAEPDVRLVGVDPERLEQFDQLRSPGNQVLDLSSLEPGQVIISEKVAEEMNAGAGDTITVFHNNETVQLDVVDVARNSYLTGVQRSVDTGKESAGMVMPLGHLQAMTGHEGQFTSIGVSNTGGVRDGVELTDAVGAALMPQLEGTGLGVANVKQAGVDQADEFAMIFSTVFMVLGMFSIAAGVLLIVLIFTMLAAERRPEMGMARAVGTHRSQLVQQFIAEGAGYALLAGLVGAALGVGATYGIAFGLEAIFGNYVSVEAHVTPRSLIVAYCMGVVITFFTVVGSSWKISRVNIVAAVRDIPDAVETRRKKSGLVWGVLLLVAGTLLTVMGLGGEQAFPFYAGMSLIPFGIALLGRFFGLPGRLLFSLAGIYLVTLWLLPESVSKQIVGEMDSGMEMFFLSGIFMVIGATMVIVNNTGVLLAAITSLGGVFRSKLPAIRTAVAYPGAARGRTGMTIAMFSLIIFSLVMMATMNQNFVALFTGDDAAAGWDVRADVRSANPVGDFTLALEEQGVDTSDYQATGTTSNPSELYSQVRPAGADDWNSWPVVGMDDAFISQSTLFFEKRATGYDSDEAIVQALLNEENVAVVDAWVVPQEGNFGSGDQLVLDDLRGADKTFEPVLLDMVDPKTGTITTVKIIGVIDSKIGSLHGVYTAQDTVDAAFTGTAMTSYYVSLGNAETSADTARAIESAMLQNGVQAISIHDEIKEAQRQESGFLYIIQGFMGLGLLVGIAAVGVISFRSVVERRQQIGVLRSLGFQRETVSQSFMIETAFVVGMGILSGTALGLMLSRNLLMSDEMSSSEITSFLIPWEIITVVVVGTMLVALLMTWIPARQATRIAPAEALRYE